MAMPLAESPLARERGKLLEIWETAPGVYGWLATVDHKRIGIRYMCTAFFFLLIGGLEALMMRLQLAQANLRLLSPDAYNQLFTMHGITMIFLYALPMLSGFSNFLWPLLLGSRDMAFPRLNARAIGSISSREYSSTSASRSARRPTAVGSTMSL